MDNFIGKRPIIAAQSYLATHCSITRAATQID